MATRRVGRARRIARQGRAQPPLGAVERWQAHVGAAFRAWAMRAIDLAEPVLTERFKTDATLAQVWAELSRQPELSTTTAKQVFRGLDDESAKQLRAAGVRTADVLLKAPVLQQQWLRESTDLIKASADLRRRVERVIADPINQGARVEDVRAKLIEQAGYSQSRAELTARDQTLKMYGRIQQERQTQAGIRRYTWQTSEDERVRKDHADLNGTEHNWDDPPVVDKRTGRRGHPGSDFQCRCNSVPLLEDFDEDTATPVPTGPTGLLEPAVTAPVQPTFTPAPVVPIPAPITAFTPTPPDALFEAAQSFEVAPHRAAAPARKAALRAVESALPGQSLEELGAIAFTPEELHTDPALAFLRRDPTFARTGNVADNFGSSKAGLPQIAIQPDGTAYLRNGRHRLTVARELGLRQIMARVVRVSKTGRDIWEYVGYILVGGRT